MPSGLVRVEGYLPRLRALGIECTVINYFSPALARNRWRWEGPRRHRSTALRGAVRAWFRSIDALHIWRARMRLLWAARSADAVLIQWVAPPVWLTRILARGRARLVYDFDDAVHLVNRRRVDEILRRAWRVVAGSHALLEHAMTLTTAAVLIPSPVAAEQFAPAARPASEPAPAPPEMDGAALPFRVGWLGSAGTLPYLQEIAEPLAVLARAGIPVQLVVAGTEGREDLVPRPPGVEVMEISRYTGGEMARIAAGMDVGVMPMPDGPWERGKCAMKALIYMAAGLPVVCSPVGENVHVVREGESGFHARTPEQWVAALGRLAGDRDLRERLGRAGRARVEAEYASEICFDLLRLHVLTPLAEERRTPAAVARATDARSTPWPR